MRIARLSAATARATASAAIAATAIPWPVVADTRSGAAALNGSAQAQVAIFLLKLGVDRLDFINLSRNINEALGKLSVNFAGQRIQVFER